MNKNINFMEVLQDSTFLKSENNALAYIGKDSNDNNVYLDLKKDIHTLVAGATGSGKSCMMNCIISSLMARNTTNTARFLLIDPKRVEFYNYKNSDMLYGDEVINDVKGAIIALSTICREMDRRFMRLEYDRKRSIDDYLNPSAMPRIFVCIDELSFLMLESKKEVEEYISKIGMLGRACGIHLILATQQPSRKVITGTIQANIPCVIGLATRNKIDSRMILQNDSCTKLNGKGDAIKVSGLEEVHFQGAYINQSDIDDIVNGTYTDLFKSATIKPVNKVVINRIGKAYSDYDNKFVC